MKTQAELQSESDRLMQRVLAIPGVELVASFDPANFLTPSPSLEEGRGGQEPPRALLFSRNWLCFDLRDDQAEARRVFEQRMGRAPEFVYQDFMGRLLWVGPV